MAGSEETAGAMARQIADTPGLRAGYFDDAPRMIAKMIPARWPFGLGVDDDTRELRARTLAKVPELMRKGEAASSAHAEAVMRQFFKAAIRNPERTFAIILALSFAAFLAGLGMIAVGLYTAVSADETTRDAVLAGVLGGSGVVGTLGTVLTLATRRVSLANANHAQLRLILTGFATELGHLRSQPLEGLEEIERANAETREAMEATVRLVQCCVKVEPKVGEPQGDGLAREPSRGADGNEPGAAAREPGGRAAVASDGGGTEETAVRDAASA